jgi:hypothetical protein
MWGLQCINHVCTNPGGCAADSECPTNQYCIAGACYFFPESDCSVSADCPDGLVCALGFCSPAPECVYDSECGSGRTCTSGACR